MTTGVSKVATHSTAGTLIHDLRSLFCDIARHGLVATSHLATNVRRATTHVRANFVYLVVGLFESAGKWVDHVACNAA